MYYNDDSEVVGIDFQTLMVGEKIGNLWTDRDCNGAEVVGLRSDSQFKSL